MALPEVIITGFPHSGTSFLAELVNTLGYSLGPNDHLKGPNEMNKRGHFENMYIREGVWKDAGIKVASGGIKSLGYAGNLHAHEVNDTDLPKMIDMYCRKYRVRAYKDTHYPLVSKYFSPSRIIAINRNPSAIYDSTLRYPGDDPYRNLAHLVESHYTYWRLLEGIASEQGVNLAIVRYEDFHNEGSYERIVNGLAGFLGVEMTEELMNKCKEVFIR